MMNVMIKSMIITVVPCWLLAQAIAQQEQGILPGRND